MRIGKFEFIGTVPVDGRAWSLYLASGYIVADDGARCAWRIDPRGRAIYLSDKIPADARLYFGCCAASAACRLAACPVVAIAAGRAN